MDESNMIHYKSLIHAINDVIETKDYCYQMKPHRNINGPCQIKSYSNTDYAEDNNTQKSVTGYIVLINGAFVAWHSQIQKTVKLYVTESEY